MRLADFISSNIENILSEWVAFARTKISVGQAMTDLALRDDAAAILMEVARDMGTAQSSGEQQAKSQGEGAPDLAQPAPPSHAHAMQRVRSGFEVNQMVSEFRALRATVLRLWSASAGQASIDDLNDVTRFNEAIDQALSESLKYFVSEVDRARNLFMGVLGHDLRTPLSTISTCSSILKLRRPDDVREVEMIERSSERMRRLVDVVLAYTRRSLGAVLAVELKPVQLDVLVRHCVHDLAVSNPDRQIVVDAAGGLDGVWDGMRVSQLVSNLVGNALKYGAPEMPISVTLAADDSDSVVLRVHNFGVPIAAQLLDDIFEPLVRGRNPAGSAQVGGANMGLGLYIAREVASAHYGTIHVTSDAETGTQFEVRLPRTPPELSDATH
ncbi:MAG: HAMP domain-containing sensor histidine kinase [Betaproteobacteria bacterium]